MASKKVIVTDANVLINLLLVERIDICGLLPGLDFVVPEPVRDEIHNPSLRARLSVALEQGMLVLENLSELRAIELFAELAENLGRGESACRSPDGKTG